MGFEVSQLSNPLRIGSDGAVRVGNTRVLLYTVVSAFKSGQFAEEVAACYPSLTLGEVYATISYYLEHQPEVEAYLAKYEADASQARARIANQPGYAELRKKLVDRMNSHRNAG